MSDDNAPIENKRKIINEDSSKLDKAFKILESAASASDGNNESLSFGQFVGKKLETYNQHVRTILQYEMSNILFRLDYGYFNQSLTYKNNHHNNYSDPSSSNYNYNPQSYPTNIHFSSLPTHCQLVILILHLSRLPRTTNITSYIYTDNYTTYITCKYLYFRRIGF